MKKTKEKIIEDWKRDLIFDLGNLVSPEAIIIIFGKIDELLSLQTQEIVEEEVKLEDLVKLYISLNFDYTRLSINNISFASTIAIEQERRLDMVWKRLANVLEDKPSQPTPN